VNGVDGEIVVPAGAPVTFTVTEPVNPFSPAIATWISKAPPGATVAELGVADIVKSGTGGGGPPPVDELPPPQEARTSNKAMDEGVVGQFKLTHYRRRQYPRGGRSTSKSPTHARQPRWVEHLGARTEEKSDL